MKLGNFTAVTILALVPSNVLAFYDTAGSWSNITAMRVEQCEAAPNCEVLYNGTRVQFELSQPAQYVNSLPIQIFPDFEKLTRQVYIATTRLGQTTRWESALTLF
tara:strand:- start:1853 stop:2167 length:315 start_codon:yes stop_codon:yes gene_type:complete